MADCKHSEDSEVHISKSLIEPCNFQLTDKLANVTVEILTCPTCGKVSIGWYRQEDTVDLLAEEPESEE